MVVAVVLLLWSGTLAYDDAANRAACSTASRDKRPQDIPRRVRVIRFRGGAGNIIEVNRFTPDHFEEAH
jgi:hypothetical protein